MALLKIPCLLLAKQMKQVCIFDRKHLQCVIIVVQLLVGWCSLTVKFMVTLVLLWTGSLESRSVLLICLCFSDSIDFLKRIVDITHLATFKLASSFYSIDALDHHQPLIWQRLLWTKESSHEKFELVPMKMAMVEVGGNNDSIVVEPIITAIGDRSDRGWMIYNALFPKHRWRSRWRRRNAQKEWMWRCWMSVLVIFVQIYYCWRLGMVHVRNEWNR